MRNLIVKSGRGGGRSAHIHMGAAAARHVPWRNNDGAVEWRDLVLCTAAAGFGSQRQRPRTMRGSFQPPHSFPTATATGPLPFASLNHPVHPSHLDFLPTSWSPLVFCSAQPSYHKSVILDCPRYAQILYTAVTFCLSPRNRKHQKMHSAAVDSRALADCAR